MPCRLTSSAQPAALGSAIALAIILEAVDAVVAEEDWQHAPLPTTPMVQSS